MKLIYNRTGAREIQALFITRAILLNCTLCSCTSSTVSVLSCTITSFIIITFIVPIFFYMGFSIWVSRRGDFFNSSLRLPPALQTLRL